MNYAIKMMIDDNNVNFTPFSIEGKLTLFPTRVCIAIAIETKYSGEKCEKLEV